MDQYRIEALELEAKQAVRFQNYKAVYPWLSDRDAAELFYARDEEIYADRQISKLLDKSEEHVRSRYTG